MLNQYQLLYIRSQFGSFSVRLSNLLLPAHLIRSVVSERSRGLISSLLQHRLSKRKLSRGFIQMSSLRFFFQKRGESKMYKRFSRIVSSRAKKLAPFISNEAEKDDFFGSLFSFIARKKKFMRRFSKNAFPYRFLKRYIHRASKPHKGVTKVYLLSLRHHILPESSFSWTNQKSSIKRLICHPLHCFYFSSICHLLFYPSCERDSVFLNGVLSRLISFYSSIINGPSKFLSSNLISHVMSPSSFFSTFFKIDASSFSFKLPVRKKALRLRSYLFYQRAKLFYARLFFSQFYKLKRRARFFYRSSRQHAFSSFFLHSKYNHLHRSYVQFSRSFYEMSSFYYGIPSFYSSLGVPSISFLAKNRPTSSSISVTRAFSFYKKKYMKRLSKFLRRSRVLKKNTYTLFLKGTGSNLYSTFFRDKKVLYSKWSGLFGLKKRLKYRKHASFKIASFFHRYISVLYRDNKVGKLNFVLNGFSKFLYMCVNFFGKQIAYSSHYPAFHFRLISRGVRRSLYSRALRLSKKRRMRSFIKSFATSFLLSNNFSSLKKEELVSYLPELSSSDLMSLTSLISSDNETRRTFFFNSIRNAIYRGKKGVLRMHFKDKFLGLRSHLTEKLISLFCVRYGIPDRSSFYKSVSLLKKYRSNLSSSTRVDLKDFSSAYVIIYLLDLLTYNRSFYSKLVRKRISLLSKLFAFISYYEKKQLEDDLSDKHKRNFPSKDKNTKHKHSGQGYSSYRNNYKGGYNKNQNNMNYNQGKNRNSYKGGYNKNQSNVNSDQAKNNYKGGYNNQNNLNNNQSKKNNYIRANNSSRDISSSYTRDSNSRRYNNNQNNSNTTRNNNAPLVQNTSNVTATQDQNKGNLNYNNNKTNVSLNQNNKNVASNNNKYKSRFSSTQVRSYSNPVVNAEFKELVRTHIVSKIKSKKKKRSFYKALLDFLRVNSSSSFVLRRKLSKLLRSQFNMRGKSMYLTSSSKLINATPLRSRRSQVKKIQPRKPSIFATRGVSRLSPKEKLKRLKQRREKQRLHRINVYKYKNSKRAQRRKRKWKHRLTGLIRLIRTRMCTFTRLIYSIGYIKYRTSLSHGGCYSRSRYYDKRYI